ncbi:MAG: carbohydrate binding domain-containing protein, partial [Janthinobacterium lividum]
MQKSEFWSSCFEGCTQTRAAITVAVAMLLAGAGASAQTSPASSAAAHLTIDPSSIVTPVSPMLYGMMTEEINHSYDGGLYAELIQNRTFRTSWEGIEHWGLVRNGNSLASMELDRNDGPSKALSTSLKLTVTTATAGNDAGVSNPGFWGISAKPNETYRGSFYAKADNAAPVQVKLISDRTGKVLASAQVALHGGEWSQYQYTLSTGAIAASFDNHLELTLATPGTVRFQLVSL